MPMTRPYRTPGHTSSNPPVLAATSNDVEQLSLNDTLRRPATSPVKHLDRAPAFPRFAGRCGTLVDVAVRAHPVEPKAPEGVGGEPFQSDYADAFELTPTDARTAEQWARGTLEHGPRALQSFVMFGWRFILRLRLGPIGSADHIAGWPILLRTPETVVIGVESGTVGRARLTFRSAPTIVSASSDLTFERRGGRAIWSVAGLLHRRILPYLLGHAASSGPRQL